MHRRFRHVDVFSPDRCSGNPLGVVVDAEGLSTEEMQHFTRWMNQSETTFLLPPTVPGADYRVRIFTLSREMPFAGHPTLGSCHAWLEAGGQPKQADRIVQECGAGLVPVRRTAQGLAFAAPPLTRSGPVDDDLMAAIVDVLQVDRSKIVDAQWADNGPGWVVALFDSAEAVLALEPHRFYPRQVDLGVVGPYPPGGDVQVELRAFFTDQDGAVREDPVTGSLNASVAQWLLASGRASAPYAASQGARLGRAGRIHLSLDAGQVWVAGMTTTVVDGVVDL